MELIKNDECIKYPTAPFKVEILYKDGTTKTEEYVVDYGFEIGVYESDHADSNRKQTIYPNNQLIENIRWL